jgi:decaprenylphospho-beta-D-erythro-pentofuranosid-2-ulose 2-reductase
MIQKTSKRVLILGANSDVAKELIKLYLGAGYAVMAASRSTEELRQFARKLDTAGDRVQVLAFDAVAFETHQQFYNSLPEKPHIVVYAAGFLVSNEEALQSWEGSYQMMKVNYCGAVSILNIIATDQENKNLERIIGISSLSGVRGRKSNFIYGSTKSAFTQYLAGLRQYLADRKITVNVIVSGYIRTKINAGLGLPEALLLEPEFVAREIFNAGKGFVIVPGIKWKAIYQVLKRLPESLVARLP